MKNLSAIDERQDIITKEYLEEEGTASKAVSLPYGELDATSTATAMTVSIPEITELKNGVFCYIRNNVVTSASGFTLKVNDFDAKPVYSSMAAASRIATTFNINYTMMFIYNETRVEGGCWDMFYGYNSDTNTIAYNIRRGNGTYKPYTTLYRYQILLSRPDGTLLPINSVSNNVNTNKTLTTEYFDPFASIYYYAYTTTVNTSTAINNSYLYNQYNAVDLRYSFNTGKTLTANAPVYLKVQIEVSGGQYQAKLASGNPIVQEIPSNVSGYQYIYLGRAYDDYRIQLDYNHPIYEVYGGRIRPYGLKYDVSELSNDANYVTNSELQIMIDDIAYWPEIDPQSASMTYALILSTYTSGAKTWSVDVPSAYAQQIVEFCVLIANWYLPLNKQLRFTISNSTDEDSGTTTVVEHTWSILGVHSTAVNGNLTEGVLSFIAPKGTLLQDYTTIINLNYGTMHIDCYALEAESGGGGGEDEILWVAYTRGNDGTIQNGTSYSDIMAALGGENPKTIRAVYIDTYSNNRYVSTNMSVISIGNGLNALGFDFSIPNMPEIDITNPQVDGYFVQWIGHLPNDNCLLLTKEIGGGDIPDLQVGVPYENLMDFTNLPYGETILEGDNVALVIALGKAVFDLFYENQGISGAISLAMILNDGTKFGMFPVTSINVTDWVPDSTTGMGSFDVEVDNDRYNFNFDNSNGTSTADVTKYSTVGNIPPIEFSSTTAKIFNNLFFNEVAEYEEDDPEGIELTKIFSYIKSLTPQQRAGVTFLINRHIVKPFNIDVGSDPLQISLSYQYNYANIVNFCIEKWTDSSAFEVYCSLPVKADRMNLSLWVGTQTQYDNINPKSSATLYHIIEG